MKIAPPSLPKKRKVRLPENEEIADKLLEKYRSMMEPGDLSEHQGRALSAAYRGLCASMEPIRTPADLLRTKGVGPWVIRIMKDSFPGTSPDLSPQQGKKRKYVPRENSPAYTILITLYGETIRGKDSMMKQELIDAVEATGLSDFAIGANTSTGWSCIKTLISKALVVKCSNPAKYMLTEEGKKTARDFLAGSGLDDAAGPSAHHSVEVVLTDSDSDEPAVGSAENSLLAMPPRYSNEIFCEAFEVVLILDDRDNPRRRSRIDVVDHIRGMFDMPVEMKRLPVGDAIWIARHKVLHTEYVLDLIVGRTNVADLVGPIRDNRYKDQKLRLKKCGLSKLIYVVEGDPNTVDAPESVETACFTTEILEGFDVQRTTGYSDTERKYGHLTCSIIDYYSTNFSASADSSRLCLTFDEFEKKCSDPEDVTVSDVFAVQLMQVPQATEEAVLAVISLYPTLFSLAQAYSMLDGDRRAQEEMLMNNCKLIKAGASKAIFKFVWAEERTACT